MASNLILFLSATGNLAGNIFLNAYILNGAGLLTFIGIWYIEWGRRNAIASAFLGTAAISVLVVVLEKSGKCDKCGIFLSLQGLHVLEFDKTMQNDKLQSQST